MYGREGKIKISATNYANLCWLICKLCAPVIARILPKQSPGWPGDCFIGETALLAVTGCTCSIHELKPLGSPPIRCDEGWGRFLQEYGTSPRSVIA
jgi:hypothetical protein